MILIIYIICYIKELVFNSPLKGKFKEKLELNEHDYKYLKSRKIDSEFRFEQAGLITFTNKAS